MADDALVALVARERRRLMEARQGLATTYKSGLQEQGRSRRLDPRLSKQAGDIAGESRNLLNRYSGRDYEETPFVGEGGFLSGLGNVLSTGGRFVTSGLHELLYDEDPEQGALAKAAEGAMYPSKAKLGGEIFEKAGLPRPLAAILGLGTDIAVDPTTWFGGAAFSAAGKGLKAAGGALGKTRLGGALGELASPVTTALKRRFVPGARLEELGLKNAAGTGGRSAYETIREGQRAMPSAVAREMSGLAKDVSNLKPKGFKNFADFVHGARLAARTKKMGGAAAAAVKAPSFKKALKAASQDPALAPAKTFYAKYAKMLKGSARKEYDNLWEEVSVATDQRAAVGKLGKYISDTLARQETKRFADGIKNLKMPDGTPLFFKAPPKPGQFGAAGQKIVGAVGSAPAGKVKTPENYIRLHRKAREIFGNVRVHKLFAEELKDMPYLGQLRGFARWMAESKTGQLWDRMTARWKAVVTGLNPGFNVRNFLSNQYNVFQAEGAGALSGRKLMRALDITDSNKHGTIVGLGGKKLSYDEIRKALLDAGVYRTGQTSEDVAQLLQDLISGKTKPWEHRLIEGDFPYLRNIAGRLLGDRIEDHAKTQLFVHMFEKTGDVQKAIERVRKVLFDYGDITYFERHYAKRLMPFYVWMRKNAPLQIEFLLKNPGRFGGIFKAKEEAAVAALTPEQREKERRQLKGAGIDQRLGFPLKENAGGFTYALPGFAPLGEVGDLSDPVGALGQRLHPLLGAAFDRFVRGKESFRDMPFELEEGVPAEVRASPIAAALANLGINLPGTRRLDKRTGAAGWPDVRQTLGSQKLEQLLPLLLGTIPQAGLPLQLLTGSSWGRGLAGGIVPQGPSTSVEALSRFLGGPTVTSEPSAELKGRSAELAAKLRAIAARRKAAEGR